MTEYLITQEDLSQDYSTGVVLGRYSADNSEEAIRQLSRDVVSDDLVEEVSSKGRLSLMEWILEECQADGDYEIFITPVPADPQGGPLRLSYSELDLE